MASAQLGRTLGALPDSRAHNATVNKCRPRRTVPSAAYIIGDPDVGSMGPRFNFNLPPYPAFDHRHPGAWFRDMAAHFELRRIDSQAERYHIATALLPPDLRIDILEYSERPYDDLEILVMARVGTSSVCRNDSASLHAAASSSAAPSYVPSPPGFSEHPSSTLTPSTLAVPNHWTPGKLTLSLSTAALPCRPPFYAKNPKVWLCQMECLFDLYGVTTQQDRYFLIHEQLPYSLACNLPEPGARPYDELRAFLLASSGRFLKPPAPATEPCSTDVTVLLPSTSPLTATALPCSNDATATMAASCLTGGSSAVTSIGDSTCHPSSCLSATASAVPPSPTEPPGWPLRQPRLPPFNRTSSGDTGATLAPNRPGLVTVEDAAASPIVTPCDVAAAHTSSKSSQTPSAPDATSQLDVRESAL